MNCLDPQTQGLNYVGGLSVTVSGHTCQHWDQDFPHRIPEKVRKAIQNYGPIQHNFCRNFPGVFDRPFCYTTNPEVTFEACDVPICP